MKNLLLIIILGLFSEAWAAQHVEFPLNPLETSCLVESYFVNEAGGRDSSKPRQSETVVDIKFMRKTEVRILETGVKFTAKMGQICAQHRSDESSASSLDGDCIDHFEFEYGVEKDGRGSSNLIGINNKSTETYSSIVSFDQVQTRISCHVVN